MFRWSTTARAAPHARSPRPWPTARARRRSTSRTRISCQWKGACQWKGDCQRAWVWARGCFREIPHLRRQDSADSAELTMRRRGAQGHSTSAAGTKPSRSRDLGYPSSGAQPSQPGRWTSRQVLAVPATCSYYVTAADLGPLNRQIREIHDSVGKTLAAAPAKSILSRSFSVSRIARHCCRSRLDPPVGTPVLVKRRIR